jgi:hypothetical protein
MFRIVIGWYRTMASILAFSKEEASGKNAMLGLADTPISYTSQFDIPESLQQSPGVYNSCYPNTIGCLMVG